MVKITEHGTELFHQQPGDFAARLYKLWDREAEAYAQAIEAHIGKHLQLLQVPLR